MTWIVGTVQPFGFSILVSDICVTFTCSSGRERYRDCLQKIYPLGRSALGGFAGSVKVGFQILNCLSFEFAKAPDGTARDVQRLAYTWAPRLIRWLFKAAPKQEQNLGCEIILASAHPTKNRGDAPWPWTDIHIFSSPKFEPVSAPLMEVTAIGKGAALPVYMDALRRSCAEPGFFQAAVSGAGAQASGLAYTISSKVAEAPIAGISTFFQVGLVTRGHHA